MDFLNVDILWRKTFNNITHTHSYKDSKVREHIAAVDYRDARRERGIDVKG